MEITYFSLHTAKLDQPRSDFGVCDTDAAIPVHTGVEGILKIQRM